MSGHNLINFLSQLVSSRPGSIGREATSSRDRTFDQSQRAALVESLPWMSKIHESLGWMKRKPYVFICVYTFVSMNHAWKGGEKNVKIGMRGILNIFPSSTSENDLFAASWVDKVWMCVCACFWSDGLGHSCDQQKLTQQVGISEITSFIRKIIYESTMILLGQSIFGQNHSLWLHNSFFLCSFCWAARNLPYEGLSAKHASLSDTSWRMLGKMSGGMLETPQIYGLVDLIDSRVTFALNASKSLKPASSRGTPILLSLDQTFGVSHVGTLTSPAVDVMLKNWSAQFKRKKWYRFWTIWYLWYWFMYICVSVCVC